MDINFNIMCHDHLTKIEKRLISLRKSFINEYINTMRVINNDNTCENMSEIKQDLEQTLTLAIQKSSHLFIEAFEKVQETIGKHL